MVVIAHNIRSTHNVGSLFRTAEALGCKKLYLTGYTPYPAQKDDKRLPHIARKVSAQINKTALGAEDLIKWQHSENFEDLIGELKGDGYQVCAVEQSKRSVNLSGFIARSKVALILGNEVSGLDQAILNKCDCVVEIPMKGQKESLNVVQAGAIAIYEMMYK